MELGSGWIRGTQHRSSPDDDGDNDGQNGGGGGDDDGDDDGGCVDVDGNTRSSATISTI